MPVCLSSLSSVDASRAGTLHFGIEVWDQLHRLSLPRLKKARNESRCDDIAGGQGLTFACLFLVIADVKTRKWNFLLEEHSKLSEMPTLLALYYAVFKL